MIRSGLLTAFAIFMAVVMACAPSAAPEPTDTPTLAPTIPEAALSFTPPPPTPELVGRRQGRGNVWRDRISVVQGKPLEIPTVP